jgi:hypothetical protein
VSFVKPTPLKQPPTSLRTRSTRSLPSFRRYIESNLSARALTHLLLALGLERCRQDRRSRDQVHRQIRLVRNEASIPAQGLPSSGQQNSELYKTILTYQAKKDNTAQITLPDELTRASGTFKSFVLCDPMEEMPFPIKITDINETVVKFTSNQLKEFVHISETVKGLGVSGDLELDEDNCGVSSASGDIKMRQLWSKVDAKGKNMELFEGFFSFDVSYSGMYRRKGHGSGRNVEMAFWAVRGAV